MKKNIFNIFIVFCAIAGLLFMIFGAGVIYMVHKNSQRFETNKYTGIEYLNSEKDNGKQYYSLDDIGDYESADFQVYLHPDFFDQIYASILLVSYDEDEYKIQKEKLVNESEWVREKIKGLWPEDEPLLTCNMDDWDIYVYSFEGVDYEGKIFSWVGDFALVGFDDSTCRIAYMKYNEVSRDLISNKSLPEFIMKNFDYDFMK